jgi:protein SCO1/2
MESRVSLRKIALFILLALPPSVGSAADSLPPDSIYQMKGAWKTAEGKESSLENELRGGPVVITMAYTRCTYTCPLIVKKLKEIDSALGRDPKIRFLIVSFDTKRETLASMSAFMKEKNIELPHWQIATGKTSGQVRQLAALLEVSYKEDAKGEFSHSNVITLLDQEGRIVSSIKGITADHSPLVKAAEKLR